MYWHRPPPSCQCAPVEGMVVQHQEKQMDDKLVFVPKFNGRYQFRLFTNDLIVRHSQTGVKWSTARTMVGPPSFVCACFRVTIRRLHVWWKAHDIAHSAARTCMCVCTPPSNLNDRPFYHQPEDLSWWGLGTCVSKAVWTRSRSILSGDDFELYKMETPKHNRIGEQKVGTNCQERGNQTTMFCLFVCLYQLFCQWTCRGGRVPHPWFRSVSWIVEMNSKMAWSCAIRNNTERHPFSFLSNTGGQCTLYPGYPL